MYLFPMLLIVFIDEMNRLTLRAEDFRNETRLWINHQHRFSNERMQLLLHLFRMNVEMKG